MVDVSSSVAAATASATSNYDFSTGSYNLNEALQQGLIFVLGQFNSAFSLIQQSVIWAFVIIVLSWLLADFGLSHVPFLKKGLIRYFISFLIVMAINGIWVALLQGIVSGV